MSENSTSPTTTGHCLCGAVRFDIRGPMRDVIECHCETCRRFSGGLWHGSAAMLADVDIHDVSGALTWYRSSDHAQRGFCKNCGASLFFRRDDGDRLSIAAGSLDDTGDIKLGVRIFTGEAAGYADLDGDTPKFEVWPPAEYFNVPDPKAS